MKKKIEEVLNKYEKTDDSGFAFISIEIDQDDLINDLNALFYIDSAVKPLKEKKKPTFKEWLEMNNYKKVKTVFVSRGKEYYYTEVYIQYQEWLRIHF